MYIYVIITLYGKNKSAYTYIMYIYITYIVTFK